MRIQLLAVVCCIQTLVAQQDKDSITTKQLSEVIVSSTRINLPLQENARTIQIISKKKPFVSRVLLQLQIYYSKLLE